MRVAMKVAVVVLPLFALVLLLRACDTGSGDRWLDRARAVDPDAQLGISRPELVSIAPSEGLAVEAGEFALAFRDALVAQYGPLFGEISDQKMVVLIFSRDGMVQEFAGRDEVLDRKSMEDVLGYTDPMRNLIVLPPESDFVTLRHEMVHLQMKMALGLQSRFSPWLSEGLAQYFESFEPPEPVRIAPETRARWGRKLGADPIDVMRLLTMQDYRRFLQQDGQRNYFESLVLTAYLMESYPLERMVAYLEFERRGGGDRVAAFRAIFEDPAGTATRIGEYLRQ
ncbi:MAG: DUF1570 domain-containing protein [Planctomycetota bacterium]